MACLITVKAFRGTLPLMGTRTTDQTLFVISTSFLMMSKLTASETLERVRNVFLNVVCHVIENNLLGTSGHVKGEEHCGSLNYLALHHPGEPLGTNDTILSQPLYNLILTEFQQVVGMNCSLTDVELVITFYLTFLPKQKRD